MDLKDTRTGNKIARLTALASLHHGNALKTVFLELL
jgi:hypothetical protein